jgi:hypothetical protein
MLRTNDQEKAGKKIPVKDWELLRFIDSFKVLTVSQLSALSRRSNQVSEKVLPIEYLNPLIIGRLHENSGVNGWMVS